MSSKGSGSGSSDSPSKASDTDVRLLKIDKAIRDIIANAVIRGIGDVPRGPVTIIRVETARDFKAATVFVSIFVNDETPKKDREDEIDRILFAFEDAEEELRQAINKQLRMKYIPHLEFVLDTGLEKMGRLTKILDTVRKS